MRTLHNVKLPYVLESDLENKDDSYYSFSAVKVELHVESNCFKTSRNSVQSTVKGKN